MKVEEDYKIIQAVSKQTVEDGVNQLIKEGYQLNGVTFPAEQMITRGILITQAMVKYREETRDEELDRAFKNRP